MPQRLRPIPTLRGPPIARAASAVLLALGMLVAGGCGGERAGDERVRGGPSGTPAPDTADLPPLPPSPGAPAVRAPLAGNAVGSGVGNPPATLAGGATPSSAAGSSLADRLVRDGLALEEAGRAADARARYEQALAEDAAHPAALLHLGEWHRLLGGDWDASWMWLRRALDAPTADAPVRALALHGMGAMTLWRGDDARGVGMIERSIELSPTPTALRTLARQRFNQRGGQDEARALADRALALAPDDIANRVFHAAFSAYAGQWDDARRALAAVGGDHRLHDRMAAVHAELGELDRAIDHLRRHLAGAPTDAVRAHEREWIRRDGHFRSLADDPRFMDLVAIGARPGDERPAGEPLPAQTVPTGPTPAPAPAPASTDSAAAPAAPGSASKP